jgi:hypothetical protein
MALQHHAVESVERVENRDRGVREGARIDDDSTGALARLVNPIDQLVFAIGLVKGEVEAQLAQARRPCSTSASVSAP